MLCSEKLVGIARAEPDGTHAETRFRLSPKRTSPFKSVGASVQSTAGSRGVRTSLSNAGYTTFGCGVRVLATDSILQFPLHFPSLASPCATRFRTSSTLNWERYRKVSVKRLVLSLSPSVHWLLQMCRKERNPCVALRQIPSMLYQDIPSSLVPFMHSHRFIR